MRICPVFTVCAASLLRLGQDLLKRQFLLRVLCLYIKQGRRHEETFAGTRLNMRRNGNVQGSGAIVELPWLTIRHHWTKEQSNWISNLTMRRRVHSEGRRVCSQNIHTCKRALSESKFSFRCFLSCKGCKFEADWVRYQIISYSISYWIQGHNECKTHKKWGVVRCSEGWGFPNDDFNTGPPGRSCLKFKRNSDCTFWRSDNEWQRSHWLRRMQNTRHHKTELQFCGFQWFNGFKLVKFGDSFCSCCQYSLIAWTMAGPRPSLQGTANHPCPRSSRQGAAWDSTKMTDLWHQHFLNLCILWKNRNPGRWIIFCANSMKRKLRPVWRMVNGWWRLWWQAKSQNLKHWLKQEQTRHMFFLDEDSCRIGQSCSTSFAHFWREVIQSGEISPDEVKKALNERGLQAGICKRIRHSWFEPANR